MTRTIRKSLELPVVNPSSSQIAFDFMRGQIVSGKWATESVVNERVIAEALNLSRTPVREAMNRLEGEGFLRRNGRSFVVNRVRVEDILEILSLRMLLETEAVRLAAGEIGKHKIKEIKQALRAMVRPDALSADEHWRIDDLVHLSIADASQNRQLLKIISDLRARTRMFGLHKIPNRFEPGKREHLQILNALEAGDAAAAQDGMRRHLMNVKESILQSLGNL